MSPAPRIAAAVLFSAVLASSCRSERDERELSECDASLFGPFIDVVGSPEPGDPPAELTVVESSRSELRLDADPASDPPGERRLEFHLRQLIADQVVLPQVGDLVLAQGGNPCDSGGGYGRVQSRAGALLFEGGNPTCAVADPLFSTHPDGDLPACLIDDCESEAWEISLTVDGNEEVLALRAPRAIQIDGRPYLAEAQVARLDPGCGPVHGGGVAASAYVAPIAE